MNSKPYKKNLLCTQASGFRKHASFAPASQKLLGFRLRSHKMGIVPFVFIGTIPYFVNHARSAFKRFFHPLPFVYALNRLKKGWREKSERERDSPRILND